MTALNRATTRPTRPNAPYTTPLDVTNFKRGPLVSGISQAGMNDLKCHIYSNTRSV